MRKSARRVRECAYSYSQRKREWEIILRRVKFAWFIFITHTHTHINHHKFRATLLLFYIISLFLDWIAKFVAAHSKDSIVWRRMWRIWCVFCFSIHISIILNSAFSLSIADCVSNFACSLLIFFAISRSALWIWSIFFYNIAIDSFFWLRFVFVFVFQNEIILHLRRPNILINLNLVIFVYFFPNPFICWNERERKRGYANRHSIAYMWNWNRVCACIGTTKVRNGTTNT